MRDITHGFNTQHITFGKNGCKQTSKESRGGKTSRTQEKGKATAEMEGLREEGHEKIGGG